MIDGKWIHSIKDGKEILVAIYQGQYGNTRELIETLDKEIDRLQTGVFLAANEKTRQAHAIFITKDNRRGFEEYKKNCLGIFQKGELNGQAEFKEARGRIIGLAEINTGIMGELLEGKEFIKMITEAFKGIRERAIDKQIARGYTEGKIGP